MFDQDSLQQKLSEILQRYFGIESLRPLQRPAIEAVMRQQDSLVVLPTGGGKSLCYQAPAIMQGGTTIVVSPLISLMKDQVDGLKAAGVSAVRLDSTLSTDERREAERELFAGRVNLLFVSPERLSISDFRASLREIDLKAIAVDEAHCISHWGHDFRPEYRQLASLKLEFPHLSMHAYTATATERVRQDIVQQLGLKDPKVLVGDFDRPNLVYRLAARRDLLKQVLEVVERHKNEAGIIYCIKRADVDSLSQRLAKQGLKVMAYHAGLSKEERAAAQDAFVQERCDLIVATVAFGMGIDRSNVRYVIHAAMPQSLEHYQQETGRAGRDGLEAECVLLHSGQDFISWKYLHENSSNEFENAEAVQHSLELLQDMDKYCRTAACRHKMLVDYFGQSFEKADCEACDICLGETEILKDSSLIAMKIISCVARIRGNFGIGHIISVLRGEKNELITRYKHDELSTYGLMKDYSQHDLRDWSYQLIRQGVLLQDQITGYGGKRFPVIKLNEKSKEVLSGNQPVRLLQPVAARKAANKSGSKSSQQSLPMQERDKQLFEEFRLLRRDLASSRKVPPYVIFSDRTLKELASERPRTLAEMRRIHGIGDTKLSDFGSLFLDLINASL